MANIARELLNAYEQIGEELTIVIPQFEGEETDKIAQLPRQTSLFALIDSVKTVKAGNKLTKEYEITISGANQYIPEPDDKFILRGKEVSIYDIETDFRIGEIISYSFKARG